MNEIDMFGTIGWPELIIVALIAASVLIVVWPAARICRRAGFSPWIGIFAIFPIANVLLLWFVAMAPWPAFNSDAGV